MFRFRKSKKTINIVIEDYIIRLLEATSQHIESARVIAERPLPAGLIENGSITDEVAFYHFMDDLVKELGLKNRYVRFYVPDSLVIMRQVQYPANLEDKEAVLAYFTDEVGRSIHVPFKDPILDIYSVGEKTRTSESQSLEETSLVQEEKTAVLFAAPREEILDYAEIMADVSLKPSLADVSALGVYRYAKTQYPMRQHQISLFVELNVTSLNIGIFYKNELEFLRYQDLDADLSGWKTDPETGEIHWKYTDDAEIVEGSVSDQVLEMGRIMNFYRFSMHQGDRQVTDIFIYGDHPYIDKFYQQLKDQYELKIRLMEDFQAKSGKISRAFIPALGLVIEGGAES